MGRRVVLVVNRRKADAGAAEHAVLAQLHAHGATLVATIESDSPPSQSPAPDEPFDLVVVLGGDGTLLASARRFESLDVPLIGINIGKVGFLAQLELDDLPEVAGLLFGESPLAARTLPRLQVRVTGAGASKPRLQLSALNDVVVTAGPPFRMIGFDLRVDGTDGPSVSGDGLIASTPTGSTAYNVAAGGPIVSPGVDAYTLTPIAAHSLSFRPIVVAGAVETELTVHSVNAIGGPGAAGEACEHAGTTLVVDGQVHEPLLEGDRLLWSMRGPAAKFVQLDSENYWVTLRRKMRWAQRPVRRGHS